jgi:hypothetical protein
MWIGRLCIETLTCEALCAFVDRYQYINGLVHILLECLEMLQNGFAANSIIVMRAPSPFLGYICKGKL